MPAQPATHPSTETLRALGLGKLDDAEAQAVLRHLETCSDCRSKATSLPGDSFLDRLRAVHGRNETPGPAGSFSIATEETQAPRSPAEGEPATTAHRAAGAKAPPFPQEFPAPFGRYRILKLLGKGGMGSVYLAHDNQLDRSVALKVPHFEAGDGSQVVERFYREARAAATLHHPGVCPLFDVGEIEGIPYLTMAYVEGKSLAELARQRPLTPRQSAVLVRKLALALQEAHKRGVVHRDLKPANVMIDKRGEPIIMDFGLARRTRTRDPRLTQRGSLLGTPAYMPPEQVSGDTEATGPVSDVYSLGVIFYELLTGRLPFTGEIMAVVSQVLMDVPPPPSATRPDLDPQLEAICLKAMAKKIEDRYGSMAELAEALTVYLRAKPLGAPATPAPKPAAAEASAATADLRVSEMGGLRSMAMAHAQIATRKAGADQPRRPRPNRHRRRRISVWAWLIGVSAALALLGLLCWGIASLFKVKTKEGVLVVEVNEPNADVYIDGDLVTVSWGEGGKKAEIRVQPGTHEVRIKKDGFSAQGQKVKLADGGREIVTAWLNKLPSPPKEQGQAATPIPLFNGRNLDGWDGLPGYWAVKDGAIVGRCPPGKPAHTFLVSRKKYRDFDLKFEVRRKDGVGNSGVQLRSWLKDAKKYLVVGPQVEIDSAEWSFPPGSLVTEPNLEPLHVKAPHDEVAKVYRDADFNAFHIRCVGKHVTIQVNGVTTIDDDFSSLPDEGVIAWQIHGRRTPKEVTFRNIEFTDLSEGKAADNNGRIKEVPENGVKADQGEELHQIRWERNASIYSAHFSSDSRFCLISGDRDLTLLYDVQTGKPVDKRMSGYINAFVPQSELILTGEKPRSAFHFYDLHGNETRGFRGTQDLWNFWVIPGNDRLFTATADAHRLLDMKDGRELKKWPSPRMQEVLFTPDGRYILRQVDPELPWQVYNASTGEDVKALENLVGIRRLHGFFPDSQRAYAFTPDRLYVYDVSSGTNVQKVSLGDSAVGWAILSPDGKRLLARHADRRARVWDLASEKELCSFSIEKLTTAHNMTFAFSPDGRYACMGGQPGWVYLWRLPLP